MHPAPSEDEDEDESYVSPAGRELSRFRSFHHHNDVGNDSSKSFHGALAASSSKRAQSNLGKTSDHTAWSGGRMPAALFVNVGA